MKTRIIVLYVLAAYGIVATSTVASADACATLRAALATPVPKLPYRTLTKPERAVVTRERASLRSCGDGFPGGEEAFLKADAVSLRKDLRNIERLFAYAANNDLAWRTARALDPSGRRTAHIRGGWDKEQVLLLGGFFYMRRLYEEEQLGASSNELNRVRGRFGIGASQLSYWDE